MNPRVDLIGRSKENGLSIFSNVPRGKARPELLSRRHGYPMIRPWAAAGRPTMKLLGIEFAPLCVPFERRMQTLAAAAWFFFGAFGNPIGWCITISLLIFAPQWLKLLTVAYLLFAYFDRDVRLTGGRRYSFATMRNSLFSSSIFISPNSTRSTLLKILNGLVCGSNTSDNFWSRFLKISYDLTFVLRGSRLIAWIIKQVKAANKFKCQ